MFFDLKKGGIRDLYGMVGNADIFYAVMDHRKRAYQIEVADRAGHCATVKFRIRD